MKYFIVGLGNPGEEYEDTRHNAGRIALGYFRKKNNFPNWELNKKLKALISEGKVGKASVFLLEPETFMNNSGKSISSLVKSKKAAEQLVVIHDDLDLPIGKMKISFNRGSGGHKGVESIKRAVKTEGFVRIRVGVSPTTPSGKTKKPQGENFVNNFIVAPFKPTELDEIKKVSKKVGEALLVLIGEGREKAMSQFNS